MSTLISASAHKLARLFAVDFYRLSNKPRPIIEGINPILGSYPPVDRQSQIGEKENYFIHDGYRPRLQNEHFDDTQQEDQWQLEVYGFAREICERDRLKTVCDFGCGSAYKLTNFFADMDTVGVDVPRTVEYLRKKWPDKKWLDNFDSTPPAIDMVIASDVIEHLPDPDVLLDYIARVNPKQIILSTPDRNLLRVGSFDGPPRNPAHVREWSFAEFRAYIENRFVIEAHFISFAAQATQCILCHPRHESAA